MTDADNAEGTAVEVPQTAQDEPGRVGTDEEKGKPAEGAVEVLTPEVDDPGCEGRRHFSDEALAVVLRNCGGYRTKAAEHFGVSVSTITRRIQKSKMLQDVVEDVETNWGECAVNELLKKVRDGNLLAIMFYLKCRHGWRDTAKPGELEGGEQVVPITFNLPALAAIEDAKRAKAMTAALLG